MIRVVVALLLGAAVAATPAAAADGPTRDVVFVANAEGGTVTIIDARTLEPIRDIDVIPDGRTASLERDPTQAVAQPFVELAGGENFAQDLDVSPDGTVLYVSRGHLADVAAFDVETGELLWRVPVGGFRADHMTISGDGSRLYVSAITESRVEVIDTERRAIVGSFPTGQWAHDNVLSPDGERVYNGSIGNILVPRELRENQPDAADPALGEPYRLTVADATTLEVSRTFELERGIRPFVITSDGRRLYAQLSFFHGIVEHDLEDGRRLRTLHLPVDEGVTSDDYDFEAPHHGLELSEDGETLCAAGRASDYVALVSRERMEPTAIVEVGDAPSWAANSPDGRHCFVASTRDDTVSVISYAAAREVARLEVGRGPKYLLGARVPEHAVALRLETFHERSPISVKGGDENIGCRARGAVDLRLARCLVRIEAAARGKGEPTVLGAGERAAADRRSFKVDVDFNREGRARLRRRPGGRFRATIVAEGTDSMGRTRTVRERVSFRRAR